MASPGSTPVGVLAVVAVGDGPYDLAPIEGVPALVRAVRTVLAAGIVDNVTVLAPARCRAEAERVCGGLPVRFAGSGAAAAGVVVMHEAARPLVSAAVVSAVVDAVRAGAAAAVSVLPLTDTVKLVGSDGMARAAADRETLRIVQAPVAFRADVRATFPGGALDVVRACTARGELVHTVPGDPLGFPLRTPWDLELAQLFLVDGVIG